MASVQPPRRRPREQVRADLLDAAERLVRAKGFRVSVDEIAAEAGMTKGAVYSNFAHRAELMEEVAERVAPAHLDLDALVPADLPVADALEQAGREMARRVDARPDELVLVLDLLCELVRDPDLLRRSREAAGGSGRQAADLLRQRAEREGRSLPRSAEELAAVLDALALGLGVTRLLRGADVVPDGLFVWAFRQVVADGPA